MWLRGHTTAAIKLWALEKREAIQKCPTPDLDTFYMNGSRIVGVGDQNGDGKRYDNNENGSSHKWKSHRLSKLLNYWLLNEEKKRKLLSGKKPSLLSTSIPFYRIAKMIVSLYTFYENVCKFLHKVNFWGMCKVMLNAHLIPSQSMSQINWFYKMFIDKDCSLAFNWIKNRLHHEISDAHSNPIECNKNVATN